MTISSSASPKAISMNVRVYPSLPKLIGQSMSPLRPGISDLHLFRYRERVVHLDAKIPDCAFNLGMAEQELDGSQIAGAPVDQCRLRPTQ
jgi:hypothetical protein